MSISISISISIRVRILVQRRIGRLFRCADAYARVIVQADVYAKADANVYANADVTAARFSQYVHNHPISDDTRNAHASKNAWKSVQNEYIWMVH